MVAACDHFGLQASSRREVAGRYTAAMPVNLDLPDILRDDHDATYTAHQLEPTIERLRDAVKDLGAEGETTPAGAGGGLDARRGAAPAAQGSARPRARHDRGFGGGVGAPRGMGGIARHAYSLSADELGREAERIRDMLTATEAAAASAPPGPMFLTD